MGTVNFFKRLLLRTDNSLQQSRKVDTKNNYFLFVFSKVDISHIFA